MKIILSLLFVLFWGAQTPIGKYTEIANLSALPNYSVNTVKEKFTIDGKLSEKAWQRAASIQLLFPWDVQTGAKQRTIVKLLRDQTYLYVAYECEDADLTAQFLNRDDPVYKDDCVEIFIKPSEKTDSYIGLEMNARGVLFDYFYPFPGKNEHGFNLDGVLLKTTLHGTLNQSDDKDQGWSLELAIPWQSLSKLAERMPPIAGEEWRVQINRWDGTEPNRRLSMWCHSGMKRPSPHNPERFGLLKFS
jgi:Carbohydrate family 9 binding domain-like